MSKLDKLTKDDFAKKLTSDKLNHNHISYMARKKLWTFDDFWSLATLCGYKNRLMYYCKHWCINTPDKYEAQRACECGLTTASSLGKKSYIAWFTEMSGILWNNSSLDLTTNDDNTQTRVHVSILTLLSFIEKKYNINAIEEIKSLSLDDDQVKKALMDNKTTGNTTVFTRNGTAIKKRSITTTISDGYNARVKGNERPLCLCKDSTRLGAINDVTIVDIDLSKADNNQS